MAERCGVREYARRVGVSHVAVLNAIKDGRLSKSVQRDAKGHPRIDPELAASEWSVSTDPDKQRNVSGAGGRAPAPAPPGQAALFPEAAKSQGVPSGAAMFGGKSVAQWRAAQLAIATRNEELDLQLRQGKLVEVEKVRAEWFRLVREARDRILIVPDRCAGELAAETDQKRVHAFLDRELRQALAGLTTDERGPGN